MNKVTPLVLVAVRECMCGAGSGAGAAMGPPRLCLAPAPRAPAPGTKARAGGLSPSGLGVPRLGARAEGRRPRGRRLLLRSRSAGGREREREGGAPVSVMCLGFPFPSQACSPRSARSAVFPALGCSALSVSPSPGARPASPEPGLGLSAPSRVPWPKLTPLPRRAAAAGHGLWLKAGPARWDRKALGTGGDRSEEEEGRWICFAKGVGLLAVGGLL